MSKIIKYNRLVAKRKECSLCQNLRNPASIEDGKWDSDQIGPWSLWQANLNAEIVVVGQDWGDISYFTKYRGRDQPSGNPTNENLQKLLMKIGIEIRKPRDQQDHVVFFTNLILCLKTGGLQGRVEDYWFNNCSRTFFIPLIEIIRPKVIIALGKKVSESILQLYGISYSKSAAFHKMLAQSPYRLTNSTSFFPLYHCGAGGVNRNRSMTEQDQDWSKVNLWMESNNFH